MKKSGPAKEPTFFWQGLLIVLPVLVLAAFGLYSLKIDRQRAEQEASEQAKQFAERFADLYEPPQEDDLGRMVFIAGDFTRLSDLVTSKKFPGRRLLSIPET